MTIHRIETKWLITMAVALGQFMSMLDGTIVNVAVPHLQTAFGADIHDVQWAVTVYMLTQAAVIPAAPYLMARFGGKRTYVWTLIAFLAGSVLCGLAWNLPSLVFFRFVQGLGGGILLPLVMALLYQAFPPEERALAVSVMGIPLMVAPALGPLLGGYLVTYLGWQSAFFINIPLGILSVILAQRVLRSSGKEERPRFDFSGFVTSAGGAAALLYGVSALGNGDPATGLPALCASVVLLTAFVTIELRKGARDSQPLLDFQRFRDRTFTFSNIANVCVGSSRFGVMFIMPIYLQTVRGQSAVEAGEITMVLALTTLLILPLVGKLARFTGTKPLIMAGLIMFAAMAALMTTQTLTSPLWTVLALMVLQGSANAMLQQVPVSAMSQIRREQEKEIAHGSTLVTLLHSAAAPLGVALLSSIVQSRSLLYSGQLAGQGLSGTLLQQQSTLLGMHDSFKVAVLLLGIAVVAMCFVPAVARRRVPELKQASEPLSEIALGSPD